MTTTLTDDISTPVAVMCAGFGEPLETACAGGTRVDDAEGRVTYVNERWREYTGLDLVR